MTKKLVVLTFLVAFFLCLELQAQVAVTCPMSYAGNWQSKQVYVKCNVVMAAGMTYVALLANINSQPSPTNPNWQCLSCGGGSSIPGLSSDGNNGIKVTGNVSAASVNLTTPPPSVLTFTDSKGVPWQCGVRAMTPISATLTCVPAPPGGTQ